MCVYIYIYIYLKASPLPPASSGGWLAGWLADWLVGWLAGLAVPWAYFCDRLIANMSDLFDPKLHFLRHWRSILVPWWLDFWILGHHVSDPWVHRDTKGDTLESKVGFSLILD